MSNPFSFAVPSSFQNQAAICLSTANIGINFQSTKFFRENFCRTALFPKFPSLFIPLIGFLLRFRPPFPSFPVLCLVLPPHTRAHTHAHACAPIRAHDARARLRSHAHARNISPNIIHSYYTTKDRKEKYFFIDIFAVKVNKTHCKSDSYK